LHYAAKYGNADIVKTLLEAGDNIESQNKYGQIDIHY
jgi:ankyrin repeat protein